jgi:hypothetical protein
MPAERAGELMDWWPTLQRRHAFDGHQGIIPRTHPSPVYTQSVMFPSDGMANSVQGAAPAVQQGWADSKDCAPVSGPGSCVPCMPLPHERARGDHLRGSRTSRPQRALLQAVPHHARWCRHSARLRAPAARAGGCHACQTASVQVPCLSGEWHLCLEAVREDDTQAEDDKHARVASALQELPADAPVVLLLPGLTGAWTFL